MLKVLSPKFHGFLDYAVVALFALAPILFGFSGIAAILAYVLAGVHCTMTLLTAFPLGVAKLIPFKVHGVIEAVAAVTIAAAPWLFRFASDAVARNFYIMGGALIAVVILLTNYETVESEAGIYRARRAV